MLLIGCSKDPISSETTDNNEITVDKLFTNDGCTIYRFTDGGKLHYYARCEKSVDTISTNYESCGKGCFRAISDNITTKAE